MAWALGVEPRGRSKMSKRLNIATALSALLLSSAQFVGTLEAAEVDRVTLAIPSEPKDLDPCNIISSGIGLVLRQNVVETLTTLNPDDSSPKPKLAEQWTQRTDGSWRS
jgi:peptide/nickel transport system substrate-binding protein